MIAALDDCKTFCQFHSSLPSRGSFGIVLYSQAKTAMVFEMCALGVSCGGDNGGVLLYPESAVNDGSGQMEFLGTISDLTLSPTLPNTGNGGASIKGAVSSLEDGSDGIVVLRYDTALAATGFDATGSVIAGVALTAAGVFFARRRQLAS